MKRGGERERGTIPCSPKNNNITLEENILLSRFLETLEL